MLYSFRLPWSLQSDALVYSLLEEFYNLHCKLHIVFVLELCLPPITIIKSTVFNLFCTILSFPSSLHIIVEASISLHF